MKLLTENTGLKTFEVAFGFKNETAAKKFTKKDFVKLLNEAGLELNDTLNGKGRITKRVAEYKVYSNSCEIIWTGNPVSESKVGYTVEFGVTFNND